MAALDPSLGCSAWMARRPRVEPRLRAPGNVSSRLGHWQRCHSESETSSSSFQFLCFKFARVKILISRSKFCGGYDSPEGPTLLVKGLLTQISSQWPHCGLGLGLLVTWHLFWALQKWINYYLEQQIQWRVSFATLTQFADADALILV